MFGHQTSETKKPKNLLKPPTDSPGWSVIIQLEKIIQTVM